METNYLKEIYDNLMNGKYYYRLLPLLNPAIKEPLEWIVLVMSEDKKYIRWKCYGSSANTASMESLAWILEKIFHMTPEEFTNNHLIKQL